MAEHAFDEYSPLIPGGNIIVNGPVELMPEFSVVNPGNEIVSKELLKEVKNTEMNSVKLLPGVIDREIAETAHVALFNEVRDLGKTRQESAHDVAFGQLIVTSVLGDERSELAALKPFDRPQEAAYELALSQYFYTNRKIHGIRTFPPMGIARLDNGQYGVLTQYDHGVRSLDNVLWNPNHRLDSMIVGRALGKSAYLLGSLHAAGWTHGDAQAKNMFVSNHEEVFTADLESMRIFPYSNGAANEQLIAEHISDDLRTFAGSVALRRRDDSDEVEMLPDQYAEMFGIVYSGITTSPSSAVPPNIRLSIRDAVRHFYED